MAENNRDIKYIICSRCRCKYINDEDFGFNRLNKIYKTCVKCRSKRKKIQIITTNKIIESPPILVLKTNKIIESVFKKYYIPDTLIDNIMSFQTGICNCFPFDVYSEYKDNIIPFKKYIRPGNYLFRTLYTRSIYGCYEDLHIDIKISKDMISEMIKDKMGEDELITEFIDIKDYKNFIHYGSIRLSDCDD
jgi:hypothetical protein